MLPLVLAVLSDVLVALRRVSAFLIAEELDEPYSYDPESKLAIDAEGDFTWESVVKLEGSKFGDKSKPGQPESKAKKEKEKTKKKEKEKTKAKQGAVKDEGEGKDKDDSQVSSTVEEAQEDEKEKEKEDEKPFALEGMKIKIPRGQFVGIVGPIGCGKVRHIFQRSLDSNL